MSGEAQADLGMDYSWLGDVTYKDWQRYHDLAQGTFYIFPPLNSLTDFLEPQ